MPAARVRPIAALCLLLAAAGAVSAFLLRAQVLVVTDSSFEAVYGVQRAAYARTVLSLRLFRPVRRARVADTASSSAVVLAASAASDSRPTLCVLFPPYYSEAAAAYAASRPDIPAVVAFPLFFDRAGVSLGAAVAVVPDPRTEGYRAGRAAAASLLGAERSAGRSAGGAADPRVLVRIRSGSSDPFVAGLAAGLLAGGIRSEPVPFDPEAPTPRAGGVGDFLVDAAPGSPRPEIDPFADTPQLVFSWSDPALMPASVVRVFDDSVYALAPSAVRAAREGGGAGASVRSFAPSGPRKQLY
jgi:hypothetical protein